MVRDSNGRRVYGFKYATSHEDLTAFNKLEQEAQEKEAVGHYNGAGSSKALADDPAKAISAYKKHLGNVVTGEREKILEYIYANDGVTDQPAEAKFVKPNISMFFEVVPVIDPPPTKDTEGAKSFMGFVKKDKSTKNSDGFKMGKTVLRVHIFDEESVSDPAAMVLGSVIYEGSTGDMLGDTGRAVEAFGGSSGWAAKTAIVAGGNKIVKHTADMSFGEVKGFIKRAYPSITYGASSATVNSISISGNTSGQLSNVLMSENYMDNKKGQTGASKEPANFEEVVMFPSSINVNMLGMPLLFMAENMFIDFNTDTSLDNVYTVKSVNHSIEAGKFTSNVELVASNQGAVKAFRNQMMSKLVKIMNLPDPK